MCNDFVPQESERFWSVCRSFGSDVVCKTFAPCCAIMLVGYGMWDINVCHHCMPKSASSHAKKHAPIGSHSASSHAKKINLCSSILCFFSSLNQNTARSRTCNIYTQMRIHVTRRPIAGCLYRHMPRAYTVTRGAPIPSHEARLYRHMV